MLQLCCIEHFQVEWDKGKASAALCTVHGHAASMIWRLAGPGLKYFANYYLIVQLPWA